MECEYSSERPPCREETTGIVSTLLPLDRPGRANRPTPSMSVPEPLGASTRLFVYPVGGAPHMIFLGLIGVSYLSSGRVKSAIFGTYGQPTNCRRPSFTCDSFCWPSPLILGLHTLRVKRAWQSAGQVKFSACLRGTKSAPIQGRRSPIP